MLLNLIKKKFVKELCKVLMIIIYSLYYSLIKRLKQKTLNEKLSYLPYWLT